MRGDGGREGTEGDRGGEERERERHTHTRTHARTHARIGPGVTESRTHDADAPEDMARW